MENFYLNTHSEHKDLLMFGGTTLTCQERLEQHNAKGTIGEWENQHCEDVEDYRKIEKHFLDHYGKLSPEGESEEVMTMTLEEGLYVLDSALSRPTGTSPFATRFYEEMNSYKIQNVHLETLKTFQTRPETKAAHIKRLEESIEIHGFWEKEPLVVWVNKGEIKVISGHHRMWAASDAGLEEVPAIYLPSYFDKKTAEDIGWLTNADHNIALALTDTSIKEKITKDAVKYGIDFILTDDYKEDCMEMFNRNRRSIGLFVGGVVRKSKQQKLEENSSFRFDKKQIEAEEKKAQTQSPDAVVAMINVGNWREQLGGNILKAIELSKPKIEIRFFTGKLVTEEVFKSHFERMSELAKQIERLGMSYNIKTINQKED